MNLINKFLSYLKRDTGKKGFIPILDGLRSLALLPVILMHFNTNYKRYLGESLGEKFDEILNLGERGVYLFFAISGFILSFGFYNLISRNLPVDYKKYFVRRLTRLEPPFIISTLMLFFLIYMTFNGTIVELFMHLVATLTYSHHLIYGYWSPINPVTWSLEVEIQFYLLIPLFCTYLFKRKLNHRLWLLSALIILLPCIFAYDNSYFRENDHLKRSLLMFSSHFLIGVLFLNIFTTNWWQRYKLQYYWDIIGLVAIYLFVAVEVSKSNLIEIFYIDSLIILIFISAFKGVILSRVFSNRFIVVLGGMCYSIYLLHYPIIFGLSKATKYITIQNNFLNFLIQFVIAFIAIFAFSAVFYILFEKPFMKQNWWKFNKQNQRQE